MDPLTRPEIVAALMRQGVSRPVAEKVADQELRARQVLVVTDSAVPAGEVHVQQGRVVGKIVTVQPPRPDAGGSIDADGYRWHRHGDRLELTIPGPPRTKKNSSTYLGIASKPFRTYRRRVVPPLTKLAQLAIALPPRLYNVAARFYVDTYGEQADRVGLEQALYDILENAGVIADDWYFRSGDGTRIIAGDANPRVELVITPIQEDLRHAVP